MSGEEGKTEGKEEAEKKGKVEWRELFSVNRFEGDTKKPKYLRLLEREGDLFVTVLAEGKRTTFKLSPEEASRMAVVLLGIILRGVLR